MKKFITVVLCFFHFYLNSQIVQSTKLHKDNEISSYSNQKLILVDFWATWCAPCIPAGKQLEVLQEQVPDLIFMMAISEETDVRISNYLKKRHKKLMVISDFEGKTFEKYGVVSLPYAVLFNQKGSVVWEGRSSELTLDKVKTLHRRNNTIESKPLDFHLKIHTLNSATSLKQTETKPLFQLKKSTSQENLISNYDNRFQFNGLLSSLIKEFYFLNDFEVNVDPNKNIRVHFEVNDVNYFKNNHSLFDLLKEEFGFTINKKNRVITAHKLQVDNISKLWKSDSSSSQISQGVYIIGDDRIEVFNAPISLISKLLTQVTGERYHYDGDLNGFYDWNFQYKYESLMEEELKEQFGIRIIKNQQIPVKVYEFADE